MRASQTIADQTRKIYDRVAWIYHLSTFFFHDKAHKAALADSGIQDGARVLEAATGSGEMFSRLVAANPNGTTVGLDLSPKMARRTWLDIGRKYPDVNICCQAVDARALPFQDSSFDAVFACYLLELVGWEDVRKTLCELRRVLREGGPLTLIFIGQSSWGFNRLYEIASRLAPAFYGRQVERSVGSLFPECGFRISSDRVVRQTGYPSRVVVLH